MYLGLTLWSQKTLSFKIYCKNSVDKLNVWLFGSFIPPFLVSFNPLWLPIMVLEAGDSKNGLCFSRFMFDKEEQSFPGDSVVKKSTRQYRRLGFDPWVRKILWRRKWQPPPVFLPGESQGQRSLAGSSPWGHKDSDMT